MSGKIQIIFRNSGIEELKLGASRNKIDRIPLIPKFLNSQFLNFSIETFKLADSKLKSKIRNQKSAIELTVSLFISYYGMKNTADGGGISNLTN